MDKKKKKSAKKPAKDKQPPKDLMGAGTIVRRDGEDYYESEVEVEIKSEEEPRIVEKEKTLYRCTAENSLCIRKCEYGRVFGKGQIVDLDETLPDGSKLKSHIRNSCFEPVRAGGK